MDMRCADWVQASWPSGTQKEISGAEEILPGAGRGRQACRVGESAEEEIESLEAIGHGSDQSSWLGREEGDEGLEPTLLYIGVPWLPDRLPVGSCFDNGGRHRTWVLRKGGSP